MTKRKHKRLSLTIDWGSKYKRRCYSAKAFEYKSNAECLWALHKISALGSAHDLHRMFVCVEEKTFLLNILDALHKVKPIQYDSVKSLIEHDFMQPDKVYTSEQSVEKDGRPIEKKKYRRCWELKKALDYFLRHFIVAYKSNDGAQSKSESEALYRHVLYKFKSEDCMEYFFLTFVDHIYKTSFDDLEKLKFEKLLFRIVYDDWEYHTYKENLLRTLW